MNLLTKNKALFAASELGDAGVCEMFLSSGADPSFRNEERANQTPLHVACRFGKLEVCRLLLDRGARHVPDLEGDTPFLKAVDSGCVEICTLLLDRGGQVGDRNSNGETCLHLAARAGSDDLLELFAARGAEVDARNRRGETPLHVAARYARERAFRELFERVVALPSRRRRLEALQGRNADGNRLLHLAVTGGSAEICRILLERERAGGGGGGIYRRRNDLQETPMILAVGEGREDLFDLLRPGPSGKGEIEREGARLLRAAVGAGKVRVVEALLSEGAPTEPDLYGNTLLHRAAAEGFADACRALIRSGRVAEVDERNSKGQTALFLAACRSGGPGASAADREQTCRLLVLEGGASPEVRTTRGLTPLHAAAESGALEVCRLFLERAGMHPDAPPTSPRTCTPLLLAARRGHVEVCKLLTSRGADVTFADGLGDTPLHAAAAAASQDGRRGLEICRQLLFMGASARAENASGKTPLFLAAAGGHAEMCDALIKRGGMHSQACARGRTPLFAAAEGGHAAAAEILLRRGANPNAADLEQQTPLHAAAAVARGGRDLCRILLRAGADPNPRNAKGETPLHLGAEHAKTVRVLLKYGADPNAREGRRGETPLEIATREGKEASCLAMLEGGADPNSNSTSGRALKEAVARQLDRITQPIRNPTHKAPL